MKNEAYARLSFWDNAKGFLMVLVVLGHLLERMPHGNTLGGYKLIYLFHMPLFVFCSGYLASNSTDKIFRKILVPYALCQLIYCVFAEQLIQATTPWWILWYLLALAVWRYTTPLLDKVKPAWRIPLVLAAIVISCISGFDDSLGYFVSISRIIVFYPFFLTGYFFKKYAKENERTDFLERFRKRSVRVASVIVLAVICLVFLYVSPVINSKWLYGSYSYNSADYNLLFRIFHYLMAYVVGALVLVLVPRRKTLISPWGRYSLVIYLTHIVAVGTMRIVFAHMSMHKLSGYALCIIASVMYCIFVTLAMKLYEKIKARIIK